MKHLVASFLVLTLAALGPSHASSAAQPLVDTAWVRAHLDMPGVVFLDTRADADAYAAGHVPGAVHTDYAKDGWRVTRGGTIGLLPTKEEVEALIGGLGIDNNDHVVLLPAGQNATEMGIATRIYWTFKVFGHDEVSILDGGMKAWLNDPAHRLSTERAVPEATIFTATLREELLATQEEVRTAKAGSVLLDHRPNPQFTGKQKPDPVARPGTIPGAVNAPAMWSTENDGGLFRSREDLAKLYAAAGIPDDGPVINFCNTGHWASVGWFVTSELLGRESRLYDGSMVEWAANPGNPVVAR